MLYKDLLLENQIKLTHIKKIVFKENLLNDIFLKKVLIQILQQVGTNHPNGYILYLVWDIIP